MKAKLLDYLICPECQGDLALHAGEQLGIEIMSGELQCSRCNLIFPIVREFRVLLIWKRLTPKSRRPPTSSVGPGRSFLMRMRNTMKSSWAGLRRCGLNFQG